MPALVWSCLAASSLGQAAAYWPALSSLRPSSKRTRAAAWSSDCARAPVAIADTASRHAAAMVLGRLSHFVIAGRLSFLAGRLSLAGGGVAPGVAAPLGRRGGARL